MSLVFAKVKLLFKIGCHNECEECSDIYRTTCTNCPRGKYLSDGQCLTTCPSGYYLDMNTCLRCDFPCATCSSEIECITCQPTFYKEKNRCINGLQCSEGTYPDKITSTCKSCSVTCLSCYGPTSFDCIKCNYTMSYKKNNERNECQKLICPEGSYLFIDLEANSLECLGCGKMCHICISADICVECKTGLIDKKTSSCIGCPKGYYITLDNKCKGNFNENSRALW